MKYDFDKPVERRGTGTVKYGMLKQMFGRDDLLPLWVADMDFETPPFIVNALRKRMEHPVFGYTVIPETYWATVAAWLKRQHQWTVDQKWLAFIPGIVKGIGMAVNVFTEPGDKIIIQPPVYHPFRLTPQGNGREVVFNPLKQHEDGSYEMDFENLAEVADDKCKLLILSNPHNPAGLVWNKETLMRLADFCHERGIIVISDEIHCDMPLFGHRHTPFAMVSDKAAQCSITFGAPSKTFNIAGIVSSYAIVPNDSLRRRFFTWLEANEFSDPTMFATIATEAAFTDEGDEWRKQMLRYVESRTSCLWSSSAATTCLPLSPCARRRRFWCGSTAAPSTSLMTLSSTSLSTRPTSASTTVRCSGKAAKATCALTSAHNAACWSKPSSSLQRL